MVLILAFLYFAASVLAFVAGTICAYIDGWTDVRASYRLAFGGFYLVLTALVLIGFMDAFVDSVVMKGAR